VNGSVVHSLFVVVDNSYQQILQYHMEHSDYVSVIETCKRFG